MFGASKSGSAVATDPQFEYVAALLNGDGTNGAQNNTFIDSSTNNATITRFGNATQGTAAPYGDSWSTYFPGSAYFTSAALATNQLTGNYTIEFWFNQTVAGKQGLITVTATASSGAAGMSVYIDSAPTNSLTLFIDGNTNTFTTTTNIFSLNTWNHVAVVYTSSATRGTLYLNGTCVGNLTRTATFAATPAISIGRIFSDNVANTFNGYISNVRILKGTALYTGATVGTTYFTPPTAPLTAITNTYFLTSQANNFLDNGPNALALTATGSPTVQRFSPFGSYSVTPTSYSTKFSGVGTDYLTATSNAVFAFPGAFTVEGWFYWPEIPYGGSLLGVLISGGFNFYTNGIYLGFNIYGSGNVCTVAAFPSRNVWHHIAMTRDGSNNCTIWVDGVSSATGTSSQSFVQGAWTIYGGTNNGNPGAFNGIVSNLRVVKGTAVYTSAFTPPTAPLTAITNTALLTCQSTTIIDNSTNAFTLTATGSPTPKPFNPFGYSTSAIQSYSPAIYGGSGYFDGTGDYLTIPYNAAYNFALNSQICFEAWVYTTSTTTFVLAGRNWSFGGTGPTWSFSLNSGITPTWNISTTGSATYVMAQSAVNGVLGQWNHYAFTRDSSNVVRIFVNGVVGVTRTDGQAMTSASGSIFVGVSTNLASPYANGYMSNVRLVVGSPIYTSNFVPPAAPLTAVTNTQLLLSTTNAGIYDSAMMIDYETVGNAQVSTSVKKYGTGSMAFDGTGDWLICADTINQQFNLGNFTLEGWVYLNAIGVAYSIVSKGAAATGWSVGITAANKLQISYTAASLIGATSLVASTWYYFTAVRSGTAIGNIKIYLNGVLDGSSASAVNDNFNQTTSMYVGASRTGTTPLNGYIDDLRITKGYARYVANFTPPGPLPTS